MNMMLEALNHPADAFRRGNKLVPLTIVGVTVLVNAVVEPVMQHFFRTGASAIDAGWMLKLIALGALSYGVICAALWLICRCFGSKVSLSGHLSAWGVTYFPTALCSLVVAVTEVFFDVFWNSTLWGMLLSFVYVGILLWKAILFFVYLKEFAELKGWRFFAAALLIAVVIVAMAALSGYLGLKTPVI